MRRAAAKAALAAFKAESLPAWQLFAHNATRQSFTNVNRMRLLALLLVQGAVDLNASSVLEKGCRGVLCVSPFPLCIHPNCSKRRRKQ